MTEEVKLHGIQRALVRKELMTTEKVIEISGKASAMHMDLISYIQSKNLVDETELAKLISLNLGFTYCDLDVEYNPKEAPKQAVDDGLVIRTQILPVKLIDPKTLLVAISNPSSIKVVDKLQFDSGLRIQTCIAEPTKIREKIDQVYGQFESGKSISTDELVRSIMNDGSVVDDEDEKKKNSQEEQDSAQPTVQYINKLLRDAIRMKASDLHFEPFEKTYRIRFRIDGILMFIEQLPLQVASRLSSRIKVMSGMDISEKRQPQDGRIRLKVTDTKSIDFRVSSLPTVYGEKMVLRILDPSSAKMGIDALGYEPEQKELFMEALHKPQGMILITGPTGSGKTVSLYTGLNILNTMDTNISTAEDPVEINLEGINQVGVNSKTGLTFANALRSFLRQDPDVIMVGEIRDLETAEIAIKAAQTGHMVLSTLHTNSAPETLTRLRNMGVEAFNIATSVNLVIAQRLARKLCADCKREADIPRQALIELGYTEEEIDSPEFQIYEPVGCGNCNNGYRGRVGVYEVVKINHEISKLIMMDGNAIQIAEKAEELGYPNLRKSGLKKARAGLTSIQEVMRITSD